MDGVAGLVRPGGGPPLETLGPETAQAVASPARRRTRGRDPRFFRGAVARAVQRGKNQLQHRRPVWLARRRVGARETDGGDLIWDRLPQSATGSAGPCDERAAAHSACTGDGSGLGCCKPFKSRSYEQP